MVRRPAQSFVGPAPVWCRHPAGRRALQSGGGRGDPLLRDGQRDAVRQRDSGRAAARFCRQRPYADVAGAAVGRHRVVRHPWLAGAGAAWSVRHLRLVATVAAAAGCTCIWAVWVWAWSPPASWPRVWAGGPGTGSRSSGWCGSGCSRRWRRQMYARRWNAAMANTGLAVTWDRRTVLPELRRVACTAVGEVLTVRMVTGQVPDDYAKASPAVGAHVQSPSRPRHPAPPPPRTGDGDDAPPRPPRRHRAADPAGRRARTWPRYQSGVWRTAAGGCSGWPEPTS